MPVEITAMITVLRNLLIFLEQIGLPGLLIMFIIGPVIVLCLIIYMNHLANVRSEKQQAENRKANEKLLEAYRKDTQEILRQITKKNEELIDSNEKLVLRLKSCEEQSSVMHTMVINNTLAMEQLTQIIKATFRR